MEYAKEEYEIQLYGHSLKELKSDTEEYLQLKLKQTLDTLCASIEADIKDPAKKALFLEKKEKVHQNLIKEVREKLAPFNANVDKHMSIPDYVLLPENKEHDINKPQYTEQDEHALKKEVEKKMQCIAQNVVTLRGFNQAFENYAAIEPAMKMEEKLHAHVQKVLQEGRDSSTLAANLDKIEALIEQMNMDKK
ncbi:uncharacterized protein LOC132265679 [Phlebotomus argentipes]|uniref:uncharacterized protein LOC132265679 n=1 Tax=Phlebotomus argentipes TaxID=94469 RepID=UPI002892B31F|nr:uncharacterized protein LOC132265679 [Phlebotomus argentipes]